MPKREFSFIEFIDEYYWEISVVLSILFFIFVAIFYKQISKKLVNKNEEDFNILPPLWKRNYAKVGKKNETRVREIFEKIFQKPFPTVRPNFLRNNKTGKNLELDGYNSDLNLAFEYQGQQHYSFSPYFHKTEDDFKKQLEHDRYKVYVCKKKNINLVIIPYLLKNDELEPYIRMRLREINYL